MMFKTEIRTRVKPVGTSFTIFPCPTLIRITTYTIQLSYGILDCRNIHICICWFLTFRYLAVWLCFLAPLNQTLNLRGISTDITFFVINLGLVVFQFFHCPIYDISLYVTLLSCFPWYCAFVKGISFKYLGKSHSKSHPRQPNMFISYFQRICFAIFVLGIMPCWFLCFINSASVLQIRPNWVILSRSVLFRTIVFLV